MWNFHDFQLLAGFLGIWHDWICCWRIDRPCRESKGKQQATTPWQKFQIFSVLKIDEADASSCHQFYYNLASFTILFIQGLPCRCSSIPSLIITSKSFDQFLSIKELGWISLGPINQDD
jgi:hypothetical protein